MSQHQVEELQNHTFTVDELTHIEHNERTIWTVHNGTLTLRYNALTIAGETRSISRAVVQDSDGFWTFPYHDCWIVGDWVVSYVVPILKATTDSHQQYRVMGEVYVDIKLDDLDINQCSHGNTSDDEFADTHHCHPTSVCSPLSGKGFKLGSYTCNCKPGYYRPNASKTEQYFNGENIEVHYKSVCQNVTSLADDKFTCLPCKPGCGNCTSGQGCLYQWDFPMRTALVVINCLMMIIPIALIVFVIRNRNVRIIRSASFRLLIVILIAAELSFANIIVKYFEPTGISCSLIEWIEHTAFILLHGTLFLRVYRIVLIFTTHLSHLAMIEARMRDQDLLKKLLLMITTIVLYLMVWSAVETPETRVVVADNGLKFNACHRTWWHYAVGVFYVCLLAWGAYLGFKVRKVPSSYNESKLIFLLIYLVVVLYVFYIILDLFSPFRDNPDNSFIMDFTFSTLRNNLILFFLFANKVYATWKGEGDKELVTFNKQQTCSSNSSHSSGQRMSIASRRPGSVSSASMALDKFEDDATRGVYHAGENGTGCR